MVVSHWQARYVMEPMEFHSMFAFTESCSGRFCSCEETPPIEGSLIGDTLP